VTLDAFIARARAVRAARGQATEDPALEFEAGVRLAMALFLERECSRHAADIRDIESDLSRLCDAHPWIGPALELAGETEHVEVC